MTCAGNDVAGAEGRLDIPLHLEAEDRAQSAGRNGGADTKVHGSEGVDSTLEVTMSTQDAKVRSTLAQRELTSSCAATEAQRKKCECVRGRRVGTRGTRRRTRRSKINFKVVEFKLSLNFHGSMPSYWLYMTIPIVSGGFDLALGFAVTAFLVVAADAVGAGDGASVRALSVARKAVTRRRGAICAPGSVRHACATEAASAASNRAIGAICSRGFAGFLSFA